MADTQLKFLGIDMGSISSKLVLIDSTGRVIHLDWRRNYGRPVETIRDMLNRYFAGVNDPDLRYMVAATGSGARLFCQNTGFTFYNELICQARAIGQLHPETRTLLEMGGQDSKIIYLSPGSKTNMQPVRMEDFSVNTSCAAGTGSFLDQQAARLGISIEEEFGNLAELSDNPPRIAGRCSVFAKSDMIHLQQQGAEIHDIVAGLCFGLARSLKADLFAGRPAIRPMAFCGGVASNRGVIRAVESIFNLQSGELRVPEMHRVTGALGAAFECCRNLESSGVADSVYSGQILNKIDAFIAGKSAETTSSARLAGFEVGSRMGRGSIATVSPAGLASFETISSTLSASCASPATATSAALQNRDGVAQAYIGIDVGSISTNLAVLDQAGDLVASEYLMTAGKPLEAVWQGLERIRPLVEKTEICGVGVTGSGRQLIGDITGADLIINEITAQAAGAVKVCPDVDTIFEIGGQDSKYISLEEGVVVDFEMNHACAAGTGSFLEEQAGRLDLKIQNEFADAAFCSRHPVQLGERCTVFIESDLLNHMQQGAERNDLVAGLAYSIVHNYLNRVVGNRKIGKRVCFQGGTAFNRAVVAAFEAVLEKPVMVTPNHEVTGAVGAAELARINAMNARDRVWDTMKVGAEKSSFSGFDNFGTEFASETFECQKCSNACEIRRVEIPGGEPLFYGGRCDAYNRRSRGRNSVDVPDLFAERQHMLLKYAGLTKQKNPAKAVAATKLKKIGIPMCLGNYQHLPLWSRFFQCLGFEVLLSGDSTGEVIQKGVQAVLSQPCFPIKAAHGHVLKLLKKNPDYIWLPSVVSMERDYPENSHNHLCPYVQAIPYQVRASLELLDSRVLKSGVQIIDIPVRMDNGFCGLLASVTGLEKELSVSRKELESALRAALKAQKSFEKWCVRRGREAFRNKKPDVRACVIIGRPYNACDLGLNLDIASKFRDMNVLALPMDFIDLSRANVTDKTLQSRMYWKHGQRILRAACIVRDTPDLNAVYISNFGCGPDSFLIPLFKEVVDGVSPVSGAGSDKKASDGDASKASAISDGRSKPALVLEIDEHSADAGILTRMEAFLESLSASEKLAAHRGLDQKVPEGEKACDHKLFCVSGRANGLKNRVLYLPWMGDHAYALAAAFGYCGQKTEVLPMGSEKTLATGRRYTTGKECLPCIITSGDMINKLEDSGIHPEQAAFFMPSCSGPCRFGLYSSMQQLILKRCGVAEKVPIISLNQNEKFYKSLELFDKNPARLAYGGIAAVDLLNKILLKTRPYEKKAGLANRVYTRCLEEVTSAVGKGVNERKISELIRSCGKKMAAVRDAGAPRKPLVCVVGEIYVRNHPFANNQIIRRLEELGAEVLLAGITEWFYYTNYIRARAAARKRRWSLYLQNRMQDIYQYQAEKFISRGLKQSYGQLAERNIQLMLDVAEPYIHDSFEGEAILSIGKILESAHLGIAGAVNVMPFGCMPSTVVSAIGRKISDDYDKLPILSMACDGQSDPGLTTRLEAFMYQANNYPGRHKQTARISC